MSTGIVALIVVGGVVVTGAALLLVVGAEWRERALDLVVEFWDWLRLGR